MSVLAAAPASRTLETHRWTIVWIVALGATFALYLLSDDLAWLSQYPRAWEIPLRFWISDFMNWLINDATFGLFTFQQLTRAVSWVVQQPYVLARSLLSDGFLEGQGSQAVVIFPRVPWLALVGVTALMALQARDGKFAVLIGGCFLYLAVFGQWDSAMVTLSSIVIAVPFGVAGGLALGILGARSKRFELAITPLLDLMQTVPVFAYLVPILILFGFGPVSAMIATIIYAMPPMVRVTMLALKLVPEEITEFGHMAGCTPRQLLWKVMIPSARSSLMVGVNQVIMLSLNMVIIASMIGAGGLGFDVLNALKRLKIDEGIEAGLAITLLAIALDRLSQAFANRPPPVHEEVRRNFLQRHPYLVAGLALIAVTWLVGLVVPTIQNYPEGIQITTGAFWGDAVRWINLNFFDQLEAVKTFLLLNLMIPIKRFLLVLPWPAVVVLVALGGLRLGGWRLALLTGSLTLFMAVTGLWDKSMVTVYLCGLSVVIAALIGIPIGILGARNDRAHRIIQAVIDTLQTLPSFVYLMPVVMLFRVGDFAAMIAVVLYAVTPAIRYTDHGIRKVPNEMIEAALVSGCTPRQMLWKVQLKIALPEIMLGINQTIMMALSMLVITALVGTRELGQEVYIALTKADTGRGIVAGLCVAFIAIISDRLIGAWSRKRKAELGLD
ncbi:MAG TPA: ABC transporter permease subunit [Burkholderiales bacterium]|nr:ABC transporter permease subunit [Burkholderiales bacterium]